MTRRDDGLSQSVTDCHDASGDPGDLGDVAALRRGLAGAVVPDGRTLRHVAGPDRRSLRASLGAAAVLPCRAATARAWLAEQGLVRETPLGRLVIWGEVVAALACGSPETPAPVERQPAPPKATLRWRD
jgi:hypothetical protein